MTYFLNKGLSNIFKHNNIFKISSAFNNSGSNNKNYQNPDKGKNVSKKWQEGSLYERIKKIETYVPGDEKTPLESLFPRTMKQLTPKFPSNLRCGALGIKLGLTNLTIYPDFKHIINNCEVIQHIVSDNLHFNTQKNILIVGMGLAKEIFYYQKLGIEPRLCYRGFSVHSSNVLPVGTKINAQHFTPGQRVFVVSTSKDKGFLGVMQRWDFKGLPASHGVSKYHRGRGRVAPRTKMAGHTGLEKRFVNGVEVSGTIPGNIGEYVLLRDAFKNPDKVEIHYPTFTKDRDTIPENYFSKNVLNPWENYTHKKTK